MKIIHSLLKRFSKSITTPFVYAAIIIPLDSLSWKHIDFGKINKNEIIFNNHITFNVVKSSSFLIHKLKSPLLVESITIEIEVSKILNISSDTDDYPFKIGLVIEGNKKLTGVKKFFAPDWVFEVYKLADKNKGLDHIEMFIASFNKDLQGKKRVHPSSDLFIENFVFYLKDKGIKKLKYKLDKPISASALWLSADGDDSKSTFSTTVKSIHFN